MRRLPMPTMLQAGGAVLTSRLVLILSGVGSSLLLPLAVDQRSVGDYFVAQIVIAGATIAAQLGLGVSIPAIVTAAVATGDLGRARQATIHGVLSSLAVATVIAALLALAAFVGMFGQALQLPRALVDLSPLAHVPAVPAEPVAWLPLAILTGLAALLIVAGAAGLDRRDIG